MDKHINGLEEPKSQIEDYEHLVTRMLVSAVPGLGGPALELLNFVFVPPLARRRDEWLNTICEDLQKLQEDVAELTPEKLIQNENFVSVFAQASRAALSTHEKLKVDALRNAVLNSALSLSTHEMLYTLFVQWVDQFTVMHIYILWFIEQDDSAIHVNMNGLQNVRIPVDFTMVVNSFAQSKDAHVASESEFVHQVWEDLKLHGLISQKSKAKSIRGMCPCYITNLGRQFLDFIGEPSVE